MPGSVARSFVTCALAGALLVSGGCTTGPKVVTKHDVAGQISQKLKDANGKPPQSVTCPDDLKPTVGSTLKCTMTLEDQQVGVNVTVTSVDGDNVNFDMVAVLDRKVVEAQISQNMTDAAGNKPEAVTCPDDLKAVIGATLDCHMTIKGKPFGVNVTVTSVDGGVPKYDMVETIDKNQVAQEISDQLEQQVGRKPDSVTCPGDLKGVEGATLRCELTDASQTYGVNVTVTSVDGGDVKFDFKVDDAPVGPPR
jgi:Domain of unknown function (DUF4333)